MDNQVGQSFGIEQMLADELKRINKENNEKKNNDMESLGLEVALLIASARGKGVDVNVWLTVNENDGKIPVLDFNSKLISLGLTVGMEEDWDTKRELEIATSKASLNSILSICAAGIDEEGINIINVKYFIELCDEKVENYLAMNPDEDDEVSEKSINQLKDGAYDFPLLRESLDIISSEGLSMNSPTNSTSSTGSNDSSNSDDLNNISSGSNGGPNGGGGFAKTMRINREAVARVTNSGGDGRVMSTEKSVKETDIDSLEDIGIKLSNEIELINSFRSTRYSPSKNNNSRPQSAPGGDRGGKSSSNRNRRDDINNKENGSNNKMNIATNNSPMIDFTSKSIPDSPFDEEIITFEEEEDVETITHRKGKVFKEVVKSTIIPKQNVSKSTTSIKPRPSSAGPRVPISRLTSTSRQPTSYSLKSATTNLTRNSESDEDIVLNLVQNAVRQTDLYHSIQVHLGYLEPYTMIPHRGEVIQSIPREWLTVKEIQTAFYAGRVRLRENYVFILMKLVRDFARPQLDDSDAIQVVSSCDRFPRSKIVIAQRNKLSAYWLRKYLVYLRVTKSKMVMSVTKSCMNAIISSKDNGLMDINENAGRSKPIDWQNWLGKKVVNNKLKQLEKPKDFTRALAGLSHNLDKLDINEMLLKNEILSEELLDKEIDLRVKNWYLNTNGRFDFTHELNKLMDIWKRDILKSDNMEIRMQYKNEEKRNEQIIATKLLLKQQKSIIIKKSENENATISKELFWKYDKYCKERNYAIGTLNFGNWVMDYQEKFNKHINDFQHDLANREKIALSKASRNSFVAPLKEIEYRIKDIADSLSQFHSVELKKALISLRKDAEKAGLGGGQLVSREIFDKHFEFVLVPIISFLAPDSIIKHLALQYSSNYENLNNNNNANDEIGNLFQIDHNEAIKRTIEFDKSQQKKQFEEVKRWKDKKNIEEEEKNIKKLQETEVEELKKINRLKKSEKEYKKWLKLRSTNKYVSKVDGKKRNIPVPVKVNHSSKWNKDMELTYNEDFF